MFIVRVITKSKSILDIDDVCYVNVSGNHLILTKKQVEKPKLDNEKLMLFTENIIYNLNDIQSYTTINETIKYDLK